MPATLVPYLLTFTITWSLAAAIVLIAGNDPLFLFINRYGNWYTDQVASTFTWLGDGAIFALMGILMLFVDKIKALAALVAFGVSSLAANLLKLLIFNNSDRPASFFDSRDIPIRIPQGFSAEIWLAQKVNPSLQALHIQLQEVYPLHHYHSFPSGHATSVFSLACMLAFFFPKPKLQVFFLLLAWVVGFTRVLLGQHFPADIIAGALIGTLCSVLVRDTFFKYGLADKVAALFSRPPSQD